MSAGLHSLAGTLSLSSLDFPCKLAAGSPPVSTVPPLALFVCSSFRRATVTEGQASSKPQMNCSRAGLLHLKGPFSAAGGSHRFWAWECTDFGSCVQGIITASCVSLQSHSWGTGGAGSPHPPHVYFLGRKTGGESPVKWTG